MPSSDYYATLGVNRKANASEIKKAYRKLAMEFHPDRNQGDQAAEERFKAVNEAYAVLSDPDKRRQYDMFGAEGFGQRYSQEEIFRNVDFSSIFEDLGIGSGSFDFRNIFGGGGGASFGGGGFQPFGGGAPFGAQQRAPARGRDVESNLTVGFHEAWHGGERVLSVTGPEGAESINVKVPAGIKTGQKLRIRGKGQAGHGARGDLFLKVTVAEHPVFRRAGDHVEMDVRVPLTTLALGGSAEVELPDGEVKNLKIRPGNDTAKRVRIQGQGFTKKGGGRGDLRVRILVESPDELSDDQRNHLEALRESGL